MGIKVYRSVSRVLDENTYLIEDKDTHLMAIIDPSAWSEALLTKIDNSAGLKYIILTHSHVDHIASLDLYMQRYPDAKLVAHAFEREYLAFADINKSTEMYGRPIEAEADIYIDEDTELEFGNLTMKFLHTPGHSPGGMCIYVGGHLFSGDTLFYRSVGRTDFPNGNWPSLQSAIKAKLYTLPDETPVHCGHGPDTTIGYEKKYNPYV